MIKKAFVAMQFLLVVSVIIMNGYILYNTGAPNEMLSGALIGLMVGVPLSLLEEPTEGKKTPPDESDSV